MENRGRIKNLNLIMKKKITFICLFLSQFSFEQVITIPDVNFEAYLETTFPELNDGQVGNHLILSDGISTVNEIQINGNFQIEDYSGIENFPLYLLSINGQNINSIDLNPLNIPYFILSIYGNPGISSIVLPQGSIQQLYLQNNPNLLHVDFTNVLELETLLADNCGFQFLDMSTLQSFQGGASTVTVTNNPNLERINLIPITPTLGFTALNLQINNNPILTCIATDATNATTLNGWAEYVSDPENHVYTTNINQCGSLAIVEKKMHKNEISYKYFDLLGREVDFEHFQGSFYLQLDTENSTTKLMILN